MASPSILLLDEPTSGLDSSIAYEVIKCIKDLCSQSQGRLSVLLTIHQPNSRILSLFDNVLLLERGSSIFFGSVPEASAYFSRIGFACPPSVTPTDYFLQISDSNFTFVQDHDFHTSFAISAEGNALAGILDEHKKHCESPAKALVHQDSSRSQLIKNVPWHKKLWTLIYRDYTLAARDPTLYYFQVVLLVNFAFLCGAVFWDLPDTVNGNFNIILSGLLWLVFFNTWVHAFKVYYISTANVRMSHEIGNNAYSPLISFIQDSFSTVTLTILFFPAFPLAYFMMGYPPKAFAYVYFAVWVVSGRDAAVLLAFY